MKKSLVLLALLAAIANIVRADETATKSWNVNFDAAAFSGYQWRGHVSNKEGAIQATLSGDIKLFGPLSFGGYIWQNYDLTDKRRKSYENSLTETDYGLHLGLEAWTSDEGEYSLSFALGHDWITYNSRVGRNAANPDTREIYLQATFDNPFLTPYAEVNWMYADFGDYHAGLNYEIGLVKEFAITDCLTLGAKTNVGFENRDYQQFLFGTSTSGITASTTRIYSILALTDIISLKATLAYTGLLNADAREELKHTSYKRDFLWGSIALALAF